MEHAISLSLTTAAAQPASADVVIVGGGAIGVSIAWHLASQGVRNIVVVEKGQIGKGSSAKPLGGVRANFSDPSNIVLGQRSLKKFANFQQDFGIDIGLKRVGYLFLARDSAEADSLVNSTAVQNEMDVNSRIVTPREAAELNPFLNPDALMCAAFSPEDGYAQPAKVVEGYVRAAEELGVTFLNCTEVLSIDTQDGAVTAVTTTRGTIKTNALFNCAGAWGGTVSAMLGVNMPIEPVRRMIGFTPTAPADKPHPTVPFTLDLSTTMYFHNAGDALLLGISHDQDPCYHREFDFCWLNEFNDAAAVIAPSLANPTIECGWAGLYENTPDHDAFIGRSHHISNYFYATGFSGHGFLQSPAVGELMADLYLDRESFMDPLPFSLERLNAPALTRREVNII
ncbi:NAD(P)/FAD-dependent oxidoreductase [Micrococcoides hystricis]|uniref:NAD(P)/FAD-dependent oxidoreductase n=1 Tax=Micrococcoides hystricis TaxID=1572761 RepID=A0ABV6PB16_9MICC